MIHNPQSIIVDTVEPIWNFQGYPAVLFAKSQTAQNIQKMQAHLKTLSSQLYQADTVKKNGCLNTLPQYVLNCILCASPGALTLWRANSWACDHGSDPSYNVPRTITHNTTYQWKCHRWFLCSPGSGLQFHNTMRVMEMAAWGFSCPARSQLTHSICTSRHRWAQPKTSHQGSRWDNAAGENIETIEIAPTENNVWSKSVFLPEILQDLQKIAQNSG